jgi:hypothetical protein
MVGLIRDTCPVFKRNTKNNYFLCALCVLKRLQGAGVRKSNPLSRIASLGPSRHRREGLRD